MCGAAAAAGEPFLAAFVRAAAARWDWNCCLLVFMKQIDTLQHLSLCRIKGAETNNTEQPTSERRTFVVLPIVYLQDSQSAEKVSRKNRTTAVGILESAAEFVVLQYLVILLVGSV